MLKYCARDIFSRAITAAGQSIATLHRTDSTPPPPAELYSPHIRAFLLGHDATPPTYADAVASTTMGSGARCDEMTTAIHVATPFMPMMHGSLPHARLTAVTHAFLLHASIASA